MGDSEKRSARRAAVVLRIKLRYEDPTTFISKFATNISREGLFIRSKKPKARGTVVRFELRLADGTAVVSGIGEVRWIRNFDPSEPREPHGMGIAFTKLDNDSMEMIDRIMSYREERGTPPAPGRIPFHELTDDRPDDQPDDRPDDRSDDRSDEKDAPLTSREALAPVELLPNSLPGAQEDGAQQAGGPTTEPVPVPSARRRSRSTLSEVMALAETKPDSSDHADLVQSLLGTDLDQDVSVADALKRARQITTADADEFLAELDSIPEPIAEKATAEEASKRLAALFGDLPIKRRRRSARATERDRESPERKRDDRGPKAGHATNAGPVAAKPANEPSTETSPESADLDGPAQPEPVDLEISAAVPEPIDDARLAAPLAGNTDDLFSLESTDATIDSTFDSTTNSSAFDTVEATDADLARQQEALEVDSRLPVESDTEAIKAAQPVAPQPTATPDEVTAISQIPSPPAESAPPSPIGPAGDESQQLAEQSESQTSDSAQAPIDSDDSGGFELPPNVELDLDDDLAYDIEDEFAGDRTVAAPDVIAALEALEQGESEELDSSADEMGTFEHLSTIAQTSEHLSAAVELASYDSQAIQPAGAISEPDLESNAGSNENAAPVVELDAEFAIDSEEPLLSETDLFSRRPAGLRNQPDPELDSDIDAAIDALIPDMEIFSEPPEVVSEHLAVGDNVGFHHLPPPREVDEANETFPVELAEDLFPPLVDVKSSSLVEDDYIISFQPTPDSEPELDPAPDAAFARAQAAIAGIEAIENESAVDAVASKKKRPARATSPSEALEIDLSEHMRLEESGEGDPTFISDMPSAALASDLVHDQSNKIGGGRSLDDLLEPEEPFLASADRGPIHGIGVSSAAAPVLPGVVPRDASIGLLARPAKPPQAKTSAPLPSASFAQAESSEQEREKALPKPRTAPPPIPKAARKRPSARPLSTIPPEGMDEQGMDEPSVLGDAEEIDIDLDFEDFEESPAVTAGSLIPEEIVQGQDGSTDGDDEPPKKRGLLGRLFRKS